MHADADVNSIRAVNVFCYTAFLFGMIFIWYFVKHVKGKTELERLKNLIKAAYFLVIAVMMSIFMLIILRNELVFPFTFFIVIILLGISKQQKRVKILEKRKSPEDL